MTPDPYDIVVIGGGINGVAIANDAAGRGLSVLLCEQHDLASGTSSASSKLIHGGLRYLEHGEFTFVRQALAEREILLQRAAHLVHPLLFVMPYQPGHRPFWMIRLGLFFYDHLARHSQLPTASVTGLTENLYGQPLQSHYHKGFCYWDGATDDARLVVVTAKSAAALGATILTRCQLQTGQRKNALWELLLLDQTSQTQSIVRARCLVNAAGPWVSSILTQQLQQPIATRVTAQLIQGSHLIVPKLYQGQHAYILPHDDGRVIFVLPYGDYHLVGTTDVPYQGDPAKVHVTAAEQQYLCQAVSRYFAKPLYSSDCVHCFAGIRVLADNAAQSAQQLRREHTLVLDAPTHQAPLLSVVGGKLTTHRLLAEQALTLLAPFFPHQRASWTATQPLPGGDFNGQRFADFYQSLQQQYAWVPEPVLQRYARAYGTLTLRLLENKTKLADLGEHFGAGLYANEVHYLQTEEWAQTAQDILWRRTQLGLQFNERQIHRLEQAMS